MPHRGWIPSGRHPLVWGAGPGSRGHRTPLRGLAVAGAGLGSRGEQEPRFQGVWGPNPIQIFGVDVEGLQPADVAVIDAGTRGYPLEGASEIPPGEYFVQAVLNVYTTFQRADGHTIKAHMDQWEGQQWNVSPGNLMSGVERVRVDPGGDDVIRIALTDRMPPIDPPQDTRYVKHIKFRSEILSEWWGHDMEPSLVTSFPTAAARSDVAHVRVRLDSSPHADAAAEAMASLGLQRELVDPDVWYKQVGTDTG